jgi:hypothetical protein
VIDAKWRAYGRRFFVHSLRLYIVLLALFQLMTQLVVGTTEARDVNTSVFRLSLSQLGETDRFVLAVVVGLAQSLLCLWFLWREVQQWITVGTRQYLLSGVWNAVELVSSVGALAVPILWLSVGVDAAPWLGSITSVLLWLRLLTYARGTRKTGIFVNMIVSICW